MNGDCEAANKFMRQVHDSDGYGVSQDIINAMAILAIGKLGRLRHQRWRTSLRSAAAASRCCPSQDGPMRGSTVSRTSVGSRSRVR